jgi:FlaA1/EpsC-like NDP-sugar epimerase
VIDFDIESFVRTYMTKRPESLLAEDFRRHDAELHRRIDGRRVLVIGGAGSIGSHYVKAILKFHVASLVVVDTNENALTELVRDVRSSTCYNIPDEFITYPVDFGSDVFRKLFAARGPFQIVANFAAHKHVRSEKDVFSIEAMIANNVLRARGLLDLLAERPPEAFFCVSTDKAANPVNVMGASKKRMEETIMAYAGRLPVKTARFANVAFSNGSLPLGWLDRFDLHEPLSCPLGIRRFFVSPIESGELCLLASILGESGDIVYPKLDAGRDMVPFEDILRALLKELGLGIDLCSSSHEAREKAARYWTLPEDERKAIGYPVEFFPSDTSGEKPYEEFYTDAEVRDTEKFVNLGVIKNAPRRPMAEIDTIFRRLAELFGREGITKEDVVEVLDEYLPNFHHIETGKNLDGRM